MDSAGSGDTQTVKEANDTPARPANASDVPVKRGRGRPPKNGIAPQPKKVPTGRPRGRPPGSGSGVKKATAKKPAASTGTGTGRRGRPPKAKTVAIAEEAANLKNATASSETSKQASAKNAEGSTRAAHKSRKNDTPEEHDAENDDADADADANADAEYSMDDGAADPPMHQSLNYGLEG